MTTRFHRNTLRNTGLIVCVLLLAACQAAPPKQNAGRLIASDGVRQMFEDNPDMDVLMADGARVKCRQVQRVGSHIHGRMCMTVDEWAERERALEQTKQRMLAGACVARSLNQSGRSSTCGEGKGL